MGHQHGGHDHSHTHNANKKTLLIAFTIITLYMIVEVIGGFMTNSLALLSDAGHMLSDSISLFIGILAFSIGEKVASASKTFGYKRFEILAAVFNGITLIGIALYIFYEAIGRFANPPEVASSGMLYIAIIGLLVNIVAAWILMRGGDTKDNLNMRAAFLHVISDMLGSVGAIAAAIVIMLFGWNWADPLASVIVAALVLVSGLRVSKDALHVLMEGTPTNVNIDEIIQLIQETDGIVSIHDLHIWSITSGQHALSCHAVVDDSMTIKDSQLILQKIEHQLQHLSINHMAIQLETSSHQHDNSLFCNLNLQKEHHHDH